MSASETPKSRLDTRSFPPVSTPAPGPKQLSNKSCCHFSGSCFGSPPRPAPPPPRLVAPLPRPRPPPARLIMSSKDMSILSPMMAAPSGSWAYTSGRAIPVTGNG
uniref:Uncharacterized protein n=1 Tax=Laticauda laticaudata TaxID=8630 RepID=A0A8C5SX36_LATLA